MLLSVLSSTTENNIVLDDITMDDDSIPGLDEAVNAIGDDNESSEVESQILPFGMGAKAEVLQSSLPFGVGSFVKES